MKPPQNRKIARSGDVRPRFGHCSAGGVLAAGLHSAIRTPNSALRESNLIQPNRTKNFRCQAFPRHPERSRFTHASFNHYLDGNYAGSRLVPTPNQTLDKIGVIAQSKSTGAAFEFYNLRVYSTQKH